jgi:hypothetical protein
MMGGWQWLEKAIQIENIQLPEQVTAILNKNDDEDDPGQGTRNARFTGLAIDTDGKLLIEVYTPKATGLTEKDIRDMYENVSPAKMAYLLEKLDKSGKDVLYSNRIYLPYTEYKDVLRRNKRFAQDPEIVVGQMTLQGLFNK